MIDPLRVNSEGWVEGVRWQPTGNCDERPGGVPIELLVLHNISLPPGQFGNGCIEQLFCNALDTGAHPFFSQLAELRVSAHFLLARDGSITQFVSCTQRAWHAGNSSFEGRSACNDFSIGVEIEGTDFTPFSAEQYVALARLTGVLRRALPLRAVRGHSDIAPGRKSDPGPMFEWLRYAGLAQLPSDFLPAERRRPR